MAQALKYAPAMHILHKMNLRRKAKSLPLWQEKYRTEGSFDKAMATAKLFKKHGFIVGVDTVVTNDNINDLLNMNLTRSELSKVLCDRCNMLGKK